MTLVVYPNGATGSSVTIVLTKLAATVIDGIYDATNNYGQTMRMQVVSGLYLAYTPLDIGSGAYFGTIKPTSGTSLADATSVNISYAYADSQSGISVGSMIGGSYTHDTQGFQLNFTNPVQTINVGPRRSSGSIDGTYVGVNGGAFHTVDINSGLYRSYVQNGVTRQANLGPMDLNSTHVSVRYSYSNIAGLKGSYLTFSYVVSNGGNTLTLDVFGTPFVLQKVAAPPSLTTLTLTLNSDLTAFSAAVETAFITALAALINVQKDNIIVTNKAAGSLVLTVVVTDDQSAGVTASAAATTATGLTTVNGVTVSSVVVGPANAASSTSVSVVSILAAALVGAILALF